MTWTHCPVHTVVSWAKLELDHSITWPCKLIKRYRKLSDNLLTSAEGRITWPGGTALAHSRNTSREVVTWGTAIHCSVHEDSALRCVHMTISRSLKSTAINSYRMNSPIINFSGRCMHAWELEYMHATKEKMWNSKGSTLQTIIATKANIQCI